MGMALTTFEVILWSSTLSFNNKMTSSGSKLRFMLIVLPLLLSLMCQEIAATSRLRSKEITCKSNGIACHVKVTKMEYSDDQGSGTPPPNDDYGYDYDFYRKHGDIPSPGIGHWWSEYSSIDAFC